MSLWPFAILGAIVLLGLLAGLAYARKAGTDAALLAQEREDAEAQRKEWDIERRAREAVDTLDSSPDAILHDAHNSDNRKPPMPR